jgi:molybdopterin molybdotransferase
MSGFDTFVMVDWSARATPSPARPSADALWLAVARQGGAEAPRYFRTRAEIAAALHEIFAAEIAAGRRVLAGFDFPLGYPAGFAAALTGAPRALAVWEWLAREIADAPDNANNRFEVADRINAALPGIGPFWGRPANRPLPHLPERGSLRQGHGFADRLTDAAVPGAQPVWKLYTTGSVGGQALVGLPALHRLRQSFGRDLAVWPFETGAGPGGTPIVLAEVYFSLLGPELRVAMEGQTGAIRDAEEVRLMADALARLQAQGGLGALLALPDGLTAAERQRVLAEEGWTLGAGQAAALRAAAAEVAAEIAGRHAAPPLAPPRLKDDCFALPPGVDWTPVEVALDRLRAALAPVTGTEEVALDEADGRILAGPATAARANPPAPNSAVDGYGFAHAATGAGPQEMPLAAGRAAAGLPFAGRVPQGQALRILTGAILPEGVDTVVLEEDVAADARRIAFHGPVRRGANTRAAGEDVAAGATLLPAGHRLGPADLALLAATGTARLAVRTRLRVGVLSTGDEIRPAGTAAGPGQIWDANRPMLLAIARRWGHAAVDLGHVGDDRAALARRLDRAAAEADVILTSGGASAGDEDHVSALLREAGALQTWRIAVKPGRPLALGLWRGVPVFGLPGNPVAAFVCALIFARPALGLLAGGAWEVPQGFAVAAGFAKRKKAGRREYLRARIGADGRVEVFASEGSGRISGLSWAGGLVELPDAAGEVRPGDPVRFLPYGSFGL